jgi:hypothetical protein
MEAGRIDSVRSPIAASAQRLDRAARILAAEAQRRAGLRAARTIMFDEGQED